MKPLTMKQEEVTLPGGIMAALAHPTRLQQSIRVKQHQ